MKQNVDVEVDVSTYALKVFIYISVLASFIRKSTQKTSKPFG